jgi:hypothetical protein
MAVSGSWVVSWVRSSCRRVVVSSNRRIVVSSGSSFLCQSSTWDVQVQWAKARRTSRAQRHKPLHGRGDRDDDVRSRASHTSQRLEDVLVLMVYLALVLVRVRVRVRVEVRVLTSRSPSPHPHPRPSPR